MRKKYETSRILVFSLFFSIVFSIALTYKVIMIDKDYTIFTNPDGPDTSDYFEEE